MAAVYVQTRDRRGERDMRTAREGLVSTRENGERRDNRRMTKKIARTATQKRQADGAATLGIYCLRNLSLWALLERYVPTLSQTCFLGLELSSFKFFRLFHSSSALLSCFSFTESNEERDLLSVLYTS